MNALQKTKNQIKIDEDTKLKVYKCSADKWTIGTGRNLEDNGITYEEADYLLDNDIKKVIKELVKADEGRKESIFIKQPEEIQSVLINMAFNLGTTGLLEFKKTLDFIGQRRYTMASDEMLRSKWARQVGARAKRLSEEVYECNPDSPSGNLHKAFDEVDIEKLEKEQSNWFVKILLRAVKWKN